MSFMCSYCRFRSLAAAVLAFAVLAPIADALAFDQGRVSGSFSLSPARQFDRDYVSIGGRVGYYFVPEFEASLNLETWRGNDPSLFKVMPELRYVFARGGAIKPYGGLFLSRTFYDGLPDRNTYGAKAGTYISFNRSAHLGAGLTYERIERCDTATYIKCRQVYPELALHFLF